MKLSKRLQRKLLTDEHTEQWHKHYLHLFPLWTTVFVSLFVLSNSTWMCACCRCDCHGYCAVSPCWHTAVVCGLFFTAHIKTFIHNHNIKNDPTSLGGQWESAMVHFYNSFFCFLQWCIIMSAGEKLTGWDSLITAVVSRKVSEDFLKLKVLVQVHLCISHHTVAFTLTRNGNGLVREYDEALSKTNKAPLLLTSRWRQHIRKPLNHMNHLISRES